MSLKLVSTFSYAAYPYRIDRMFEDHLDGAERYNVMQSFRDAVALAGVSDYRLFEHYGSVELNLRSEDDFDMVSVAMGPDEPIAQQFALAPENYDFRKLKNRRNELQSIIDKTALRGNVRLDVDREEKSILVFADNKQAYLGFRSLMTGRPLHLA